MLLRVLFWRKRLAFGANDFPHWIVSLRVPLACRPGHIERAGIVNREIHLKRFATIDDVVALHNVELIGVRRIVVIRGNFCRDADRVDDERISLVVPDRFAKI